MFAYVKDGKVISVSESQLTKREEGKLVRETDEEKNVVSEYWKPAVPGLVFDEAIEFDFDDVPVFEDGAIIPYSESRKKIEDDIRILSEEDERKETRKVEIRAQIGILAKQRDGLIELDEPAETVQSEIDALKAEYASLTA